MLFCKAVGIILVQPQKIQNISTVNTRSIYHIIIKDPNYSNGNDVRSERRVPNAQ